MRLGKAERALLRHTRAMRGEQAARAALVPDSPGRPRTSLDSAFRGRMVTFRVNTCSWSESNARRIARANRRAG